MKKSILFALGLLSIAALPMAGCSMSETPAAIAYGIEQKAKHAISAVNSMEVADANDLIAKEFRPIALNTATVPAFATPIRKKDATQFGETTTYYYGNQPVTKLGTGWSDGDVIFHPSRSIESPVQPNTSSANASGYNLRFGKRNEFSRTPLAAHVSRLENMYDISCDLFAATETFNSLKHDVIDKSKGLQEHASRIRSKKIALNGEQKSSLTDAAKMLDENTALLKQNKKEAEANLKDLRQSTSAFNSNLNTLSTKSLRMLTTFEKRINDLENTALSIDNMGNIIVASEQQFDFANSAQANSEAQRKAIRRQYEANKKSKNLDFVDNNNISNYLGISAVTPLQPNNTQGLPTQQQNANKTTNPNNAPIFELIKNSLFPNQNNAPDNNQNNVQLNEQLLSQIFNQCKAANPGCSNNQIQQVISDCQSQNPNYNAQQLANEAVNKCRSLLPQNASQPSGVLPNTTQTPSNLGGATIQATEPSAKATPIATKPTDQGSLEQLQHTNMPKYPNASVQNNTLPNNATTAQNTGALQTIPHQNISNAPRSIGQTTTNPTTTNTQKIATQTNQNNNTGVTQVTPHQTNTALQTPNTNMQQPSKKVRRVLTEEEKAIKAAKPKIRRSLPTPNTPSSKLLPERNTNQAANPTLTNQITSQPATEHINPNIYPAAIKDAPNQTMHPTITNQLPQHSQNPRVLPERQQTSQINNANQTNQTNNNTLTNPIINNNHSQTNQTQTNPAINRNATQTNQTQTNTAINRNTTQTNQTQTNPAINRNITQTNQTQTNTNINKTHDTNTSKTKNFASEQPTQPNTAINNPLPQETRVRPTNRTPQGTNQNAITRLQQKTQQNNQTKPQDKNSGQILDHTRQTQTPRQPIRHRTEPLREHRIPARTIPAKQGNEQTTNADKTNALKPTTNQTEKTQLQKNQQQFIHQPNHTINQNSIPNPNHTINQNQTPNQPKTALHNNQTDPMRTNA